MLKPGDIVKSGLHPTGAPIIILRLWHDCYVGEVSPGPHNLSTARMKQADTGLVVATAVPTTGEAQVMVLVNGTLGWVWTSMLRNA